MASQRLNQYKKNSSRQNRVQKQSQMNRSTLIRDEQTGFIHHPAGFPLECKRLWFGAYKDYEESDHANIGLIFDSEKYIRPGASIEITIPLRNEIEKFRGKVVLVRHNGDFYEIGMWLKRREDASRARIVEQICHIESYLKDKKFKEGPYIINRERVAEEWIGKYASTVPSL